MSVLDTLRARLEEAMIRGGRLPGGAPEAPLEENELRERIRQATSPREIRALWRRFRSGRTDRIDHFAGAREWDKGSRVVAEEAPAWDRRLARDLAWVARKKGCWTVIEAMAENPRVSADVVDPCLGAIRDEFQRQGEEPADGRFYRSARVGLAGDALAAFARRGFVPADHPVRQVLRETEGYRDLVSAAEGVRSAILELELIAPDELEERLSRMRRRIDEVMTDQQRAWAENRPELASSPAIEDVLYHLCRRGSPDRVAEHWRALARVAPQYALDVLGTMSTDRLDRIEADDLVPLLRYDLDRIRQGAMEAMEHIRQPGEERAVGR